MTEPAADLTTAAPVAPGALGGPGLAQQVRGEVVRLYLAHWRGTMVALVIITASMLAAWREHLARPVATAWCVGVAMAYGMQALASLRLERGAAQAAAVRRWLPLLMAGVAVSASLWGLVPWLLHDAPLPLLLLAALFNAMLMFCAANAAGTHGMWACAVVPLSVLTVSALASRDMPYPAASAATVLCVVIALFGLRVQRAMAEVLTQRLVAADLAASLQQHQQRLLALADERARLLERQRLTRDMHDGLGGSLAAALKGVEQGQIAGGTLVALLRDCLDELRMVIESLEPIHADLGALLATQRARLEQRLRAAGLQLRWTMDNLPPLPWMGPSQALQVTRIVQESVANAIRHANARWVSVSAAASDHGGVLVRISDDGQGFDPDAPAAGRGLPSLRRRAQALNARLAITSGPAGTRTDLWLPASWPADAQGQDGPV